MQNKSIEDIKERYELELDRIIKTIKKEKAKRVLLQFPDGMKPYSTVIAKEIEEKTKSNVFIFFGSCYGACDVPYIDEKIGIDLIIQFGHSSWDFKKDKKIKVLK